MYQKGKAKGIIKMSLFLILVLLVYPAYAERGTGELELKSVEATMVKIDKTVSINKGASGAVSTNGKTTTTSEDKDIKRFTKPIKIKTYIVIFKEAPVASYKGNIPGLKATSIRVTGAKRLNLESKECRAYIKHLDEEQSDFIEKMSQVVKRSPNVVKKYKMATNGIVAELTENEARAVKKMSGVKNVIPDWIEKVQTDAGPKFIGAEGIWDGSATGVSTKGEGIIVGVIDTGINMDHPSFADVGGDGHDHTNPKGSGAYTGWCDPEDPNYDRSLPCNDKLIGVWSGDEDSPEDANGHGTHTASTAAGNVVNNVTINAPTTSLTLTEPISGVAPHANIIAYNIEAEAGLGSAWGSVIIAATEQAIIDGVDVINYSFGSGGGDPWIFAEHWFNVREAGIFVATSAGNSGPDPDTIGSPANAPWLMSVAASSHNRKLGNALTNLNSGATSLDDIEGEGLTGELASSPIIYAGDIDSDNCGCDGDYAPNTFNGEIVVCDYNSPGHEYIGRVKKSENLANAGAGGFILINKAEWKSALMVDSYAIPGLGIPYDKGEELKIWLASGEDHAGAIRGVLVESAPGDILAGFSSRGPNGPLLDVIKPDITAPGRRIIAAVNTTNSTDPPEFDIYQGTSMSSPHAAGAAALMRALYPGWTPAEIQSVLMSTALSTTLKEDAATSADPFDVGAGRIDLNLAANAGLTLDETPENLWNSNPLTGGDPTALNLASLCNSNCVGGCSWTRIVRNTLGQSVTWTASVDAPSEVNLDVSPGNFTISSNETQEIVITINVIGMPVDEWIFGSVMLSADGGVASDAHFPVAVLPSNGNLPDSMTIETRRNAGSQTLKDLEAIEISEMTVEVDGLVKATFVNQDLSEDPTRDNPFDNLNDGTVFYIVTNVPSGAKRLVAEITASDAPDIDLFVGTGHTPSEATQVCSSTTPSWKEYCNINDPAPGDWWILVQNWAESGIPPDAVTLAYAIVEDGDNGNMSIAGPDNVSTGEPFGLSVLWNEPTMVAGDRWYGRFSVGTDSGNPGNVGSVNVDLIRYDDDVVKTVDSATAFPGDTLTYQITVQPNVTNEDILYTLTDVIPDGLTYVAGSATATVGAVNVSGNILTWSGVMPTLVGVEGGYVMTTSDNDPLCDTGFGGYVNLEDHDISSDPGISGDTVAYTAFSSGDPIAYFGHDYTGMSFTDDGFAIFDFANNYGGYPRTPQSIPDSALPNNVLAAFWHDFEIFYDAGLNHGVSLATDGYPGGAIIVEYDDVQLYGGSDPVMDFEIVVRRDVDDTPGYYEIIYAFDNINYVPSPATIGVENASGTNGVALINNGNAYSAISDGFMVCFDYKGPNMDPVVIEYQATVDAGISGILANNVTHNTDNPGSEEAHATVEVEVGGGIPCDLDGDGDVDRDDRKIFKSVLGKCEGDAGFLPQADYDGDGCITRSDYREWQECYKANRQLAALIVEKTRFGAGYRLPVPNKQFNSIGISIFHSVIVLLAQCRGESCIRPNQGDHKDRPYEKTI